jgi:hypothetical protein
VKTVTALSEEQIVVEILLLLRGGYSQVLRLTGNKVECAQPISAPCGFVLRQLLRIVLSLQRIRETRTVFIGLIGDAMRLAIDEEYKAFTDTLALVDPASATLISVLAGISTMMRDRVLATTVICETIAQSELPSTFNSLMKAQDYGLPQIWTISSKMIDSGIDVMLLFIRNWTVYGFLEDEYSEFFVRKTPGKIDVEHWWPKKYVLVEDRVPAFLVDKKLVSTILFAGRAHCFLLKFREACENYVGNFGYDAPFAVYFPPPKAKRIRPEVAWQGQKFELAMVDGFAAEAMKSVLYMMNELIWIRGHLRVVQDFLLFGRGDFAAVLYQSFNETADGDAETLLLHSIKSVTTNRSYTNAVTHECLTDRIDLHQKWSIQPMASEVGLVYLVNPPIDAFLGRDALSKYELVGRLLWKLKCNECQLAVGWRHGRRLQYLTKIGFDFRKVCFLRHLMFCVVRNVTEFLSTDVILCSGNEMERKMAQCDNFNDMLEIHSTRLDFLMRGSLQIPEFSVPFRAMVTMLNTIGEFTDIEQEIDSVYTSLVNRLARPGDKARKTTSVDAAKRELADIMVRLKTIHAKFSELLGEFYAICFDNSRAIELRYLEARLSWCVANLT